MDIYSTKSYPYVYICTHKITKKYYIGYRSANTVPSTLDLPNYRTSSLIVKPNFDDYDWKIIAEFFNSDDAYDFEQHLICEHWGNSLLLNEQYRLPNGKKRFKTKKGHVKSAKTIEKLRIANLGKKQSAETIEKKARALRGKPSWNKGIKAGPMSDENKQKISQANKGKPKTQEQKDKQSVSMAGRIPWNKGSTGGTNTQKGIPKPSIQGNNNPAKNPEVRAKLSAAKKEYWARKKAQALHLGDN